jgi:hypothetical protein
MYGKERSDAAKLNRKVTIAYGIHGVLSNPWFAGSVDESQ